MSIIRVITALSYNQQGHVQYVRWGLADTDRNCWQVMPEKSHVIHVLEALRYGEDVWTVIPEGDRIVPGPRVQAVKLKPGLKTIEAMPVEGEAETQSLAQLPVF